ncbi:DUF3800 domain-containing protein [Salmonella enterica]|nr:DUF3800 domain-containing protein [Salmonella enterica]EBZ4888556.1 DUF3800 domain-containing protein [Salmonella enterica subsp. enterica serovar Bredeney]ECD3237452.1 DUF3800 domain-containing protein [Salmonella enterica subsp. enterica serovar Bredeney]EDO5628649.1 DUF3800 domain-containing protein [Salmonella enterica]EDX5193587.1 DUF3800 domain-containing protein [Salmonella enterica subsp. enterica serovar Glostrup]
MICHVACDESGTDGQRFYSFGSLWMKYQRSGDFAKLIRNVREKHEYFQEIKWECKKFRGATRGCSCGCFSQYVVRSAKKPAVSPEVPSPAVR